ncbi:MAG TPA: asparagine synthase (glutamine-hydrolyzing) [Thermoanaerobaculia bacterium]|jgi:asparagine synthase (glutamine-hydrolysing)
MCGIAGAFGVQSTAMVQAMTDAIAHRGPDDSGLFFDPRTGVALGHRRLSIIDVSSCGHQPMAFAGGRYQIVYNGEVYNFVALRQELEAAGYTFVSRSDTEVMLAAYAAWGTKCVERFRGMFAFAIYDREREELFLARDRFGIKPLYYTTRGGVFLFASELKALFASGVVERRLDAESLWGYLSLGSMPQPRSALAGVQMLEPATVMIVRRDGTTDSQRYWDLAEASKAWEREVRGIDAPAAARRLRELLEEATRLHMIADVPVGAFLSGGIDSTAVVGLMTRAGGRPIRTFSVGFDDPGNVADERQYARLGAELFGAEHTEVVVRGSEVADRFDDIIQAIDQPSLDGTNTFLVSRAAGQSLKVALSGLGGDELFAGYAHFRRFRRGAAWDRWLGASPRGWRRRALRRVPGRLLRERELLAASVPERLATMRVLSHDDAKPQLVSRELAALSHRAPLASRYEPLVRRALDAVAQTSYVEVRRYLVDTLLRDADAMAMFSSLEVRPVLLDHVVAEFAFALPPSLKLHGTTNKPVLVDAVRDLLPPALLTREKTGFELPLQSWLAGPLRDRARDAFSSAEARSVFSEEFLRATLDELAERRRPSLRVWSYLVLVEWMRAFGVTP